MLKIVLATFLLDLVLAKLYMLGFVLGRASCQYEPSITLVPEGVAHDWSQSEVRKVTLVPEGVATLLRVAVLHQHMLNNVSISIC